MSRKSCPSLAVLFSFFTFLAVGAPSTLAAAEGEETLAPGLVYRLLVTQAPNRVHLLRVDLREPSLRLSAALAHDTVMFAAPETTSSMATRRSASCAINADYFGANHHNCEELLAIDGRTVYEPETPFRSVLDLSAENVAKIVLGRSGLSRRTTVGGGPRLLRDGRFEWDQSVPGEINGEGGFSPNTKFDARNPSTAVGISRDGATLILVVVDGRAPGTSVGVTPRELADLLLAEGAWQAMRFDGGGSSTMWIRTRGVVNSPSDGTERAVGTALLIHSDRDSAFVRGDANGDGRVDISDPIRLLLWLFDAATEPPCLDAADANDSEALTVSDALRILRYIFDLGPAPTAPFPACGLDPTGTALDCGPGTCS